VVAESMPTWTASFPAADAPTLPPPVGADHADQFPGAFARLDQSLQEPTPSCILSGITRADDGEHLGRLLTPRG